MVRTWNEQAHEALRGKTGRFIVWSFICSIVLELGLMVDPWYYGFNQQTSLFIALALAGTLIYFALTPLLVGYQWIMLDTVRSKPSRFKDALLPFQNRYGKNLLTTLLVLLFQLLWTLLLIVPGIVKYFSYAFTYFVLRDEPELSALESITKSRNLMTGRKWDAFKLILPMIPMFLIGLTLYIRLDLPILASWSLLIATALIRPLVVSRFAVLYEEARQEYDEQWNRSA